MLATFSFYLFIIPGAWGMVALCSWMARNTRLQDGSTVAFTGTPGQFLKLLLLAISLPVVLGAVMGAGMASLQQNGQDPAQSMPFFVLLELAIFAWSFYWGFKILKWGVGSIQFSWGGQLSFEGSMLGYLGWLLLMYVSVFLIIAPFWVISAMYRWMCEKTKSSTGDRLVWTGTGWGLLWRYLLVGLGSMFIIPIPWVLHWFVAWLISCIEVERVGGAQGGFVAPAPAPAGMVPFPPPVPPAPAAPAGGGRYGGIGGSDSGSSGPATPTTSGSSDPGLFGPGQ